MTIVGIAGSNGSGKDTLGELLQDEYGFVTVSLSDILRRQLTELGKPHTRENLSNHSKLLRDEKGDGAMAELAIDENCGSENICITSIRAPGEVDVVQEHGGVVFWIDADPKVRYARISGRARDAHTDVISYEEFLQQEHAEMFPSKQGGNLHMSEVKQKADYKIENNFESLSAYKTNLKKALTNLNLI